MFGDGQSCKSLAPSPLPISLFLHSIHCFNLHSTVAVWPGRGQESKIRTIQGWRVWCIPQAPQSFSLSLPLFPCLFLYKLIHRASACWHFVFSWFFDFSLTFLQLSHHFYRSALFDWFFDFLHSLWSVFQSCSTFLQVFFLKKIRVILRLSSTLAGIYPFYYPWTFIHVSPRRRTVYSCLKI